MFPEFFQTVLGFYRICKYYYAFFFRSYFGTLIISTLYSSRAVFQRILLGNLGDKLQIQDIFGEVAGVYPKIMKDGTMDAGAWSCGMVAGLIHDIPTCKELVERIVSEAEQIINERLNKVQVA